MLQRLAVYLSLQSTRVLRTHSYALLRLTLDTQIVMIRAPGRGDARQ